MISTKEVQPNPAQENPPIKTDPPKRYPQKITQIQCQQTNYQLRNYFIQALAQSFKYLPNILSNIYLQLQLIVNFVQYRFTISQNNPHPGDYLQNIKYKQGSMNSIKKLLYLLLTVILPYVSKRLQMWFLKDHQGWKQKANVILIKIQKIITTLQFLNLSTFIYKGKYRTITQRLLKLPMEFIDKNNSRVLNFSLMNRKLIWNVYELFLKTILPYAHGLFSKALKNIFYLNSYMEVDNSELNNCMVCSEKPNMPMRGECGHFGCYICVKTEFNSVQNICRVCNNPIKEWKKLFV